MNIHLKYDNMHRNILFYALICINSLVNISINYILSPLPTLSLFSSMNFPLSLQVPLTQLSLSLALQFPIHHTLPSFFHRPLSFSSFFLLFTIPLHSFLSFVLKIGVIKETSNFTLNPIKSYQSRISTMILSFLSFYEIDHPSKNLLHVNFCEIQDSL